MTDTDILDQVRDAVGDLRMERPVDVIVAGGRARARRRHRVVAACAAATVAAAVAGVAGIEGARTPRSDSLRLAAFTVQSTPGGGTALTMRKGSQYRLDPTALRQALAAHGIAALVTEGKACDTADGPAGLDQVVSARRDSAGAVYLTINPAAIPSGAELSIGYFEKGTSFALITSGSPLHCHPMQ